MGNWKMRDIHPNTRWWCCINPISKILFNYSVRPGKLNHSVDLIWWFHQLLEVGDFRMFTCSRYFLSHESKSTKIAWLHPFHSGTKDDKCCFIPIVDWTEPSLTFSPAFHYVVFFCRCRLPVVVLPYLLQFSEISTDGCFGFHRSLGYQKNILKKTTGEVVSLETSGCFPK